jgi:protein phosphatase
MVALSDAGRVRPHNEDSVLALPELGLAILADGMGGYNAGEVASAMAVESIGDELKKSLPALLALPVAEALPKLREDILFAVNRANTAIRDAGQSKPDCSGMGTTLVIAALLDNQLTVAHVGDSRLYRYRAGKLEQLTRDHSWIEEMQAQGVMSREEAEASPHQNVVTRALGIEADINLEIQTYLTQPGDIFLLCSDGLSDMLDDGIIEKIITQTPSSLDALAPMLVAQANENGGRDNVSIVLIGIPSQKPGWMGRLRGLLSPQSA